MEVGAPPHDGSVPEVLAVGRLGVDLYPLQDGVGLADVETFGKYLGGSAANVAVAAARYRRRTALMSRVGDDPFGAYLRDELERLGVSNRFVAVDPTYKTPITFCEIFPPDRFPLYFYREPSAPDLQIRADDVEADAVRGAGVLWVTTTGLSEEPSRTTHLDLLATRERRGHTVLDLDYRAMFWPDVAAARAQVRRALDLVTVTVGNVEECAVAVGETDPERAAEALLEHGVELAIVKQGPRGVLARSRTERVELAALPVEVVNGLGAGDAFGGALCHGLLSGWPLEKTTRYANAAGAIVAARRECSTSMPTIDEVRRFVEGGA